MIPWKDNVDKEQAVVDALEKNGLPVRKDEKPAGRRLIVAQGDTVIVKELPAKLVLKRPDQDDGTGLVTEQIINLIDEPAAAFSAAHRRPSFANVIVRHENLSLFPELKGATVTVDPVKGQAFLKFSRNGAKKISLEIPKK